MTIITILLAFFAERFSGLQKWKNYSWLNQYAQWLSKLFPLGKYETSWLKLIIILLPILLLVYFLQVLLCGVWFGLAGFLFDLIVLTYCLGESGFTHYLITMLAETTEEPLELTDAEGISSFNKTLHVYQGTFAVLFWFICFGAVGAFAYRLLLTYNRQASQTDAPLMVHQQQLAILLSILDWPALRLFSLFFCLAGNFSKAFAVWRANLFTSYQQNEEGLIACQKAACDESENIEEITPLLHRSILIFLVIVAIMTIVSWLA